MHTDIIPATLTVEQGFGEALTEVYDQGAAWDMHKAAAQALAPIIRQAIGWKYGGQVERCSHTLLLRREVATGELGVRPFETCKKRWCPVCAWRKSLKQWALLVERLPALIEQHGPVRWLLLTLTVRNCSLDDLPTTVKLMNDGFRRLSNPKTKLGRAWPATAWLKALEITFPRTGEAHPHFHVLLAVRSSYFKKGYVSQAEWCRRWREACKLDYDPVIDIRRVKKLPGAADMSETLLEALGGLREVAKYVTKPATLKNDPDAFKGLLTLKHNRFIDGGGWLRGILKDDESDEQLDLPEIEDVATYWWRAVEERYRRRVGD